MGTSWNTLGISQQMDIMRVDLMVLYPGVIKHGWNILYQRVFKTENHRIRSAFSKISVHHITKFPDIPGLGFKTKARASRVEAAFGKCQGGPCRTRSCRTQGHQSQVFWRTDFDS